MRTPPVRTPRQACWSRRDPARASAAPARRAASQTRSAWPSGRPARGSRCTACALTRRAPRAALPGTALGPSYLAWLFGPGECAQADRQAPQLILLRKHALCQIKWQERC